MLRAHQPILLLWTLPQYTTFIPTLHILYGMMIGGKREKSIVLKEAIITVWLMAHRVFMNFWVDYDYRVTGPWTCKHYTRIYFVCSRQNKNGATIHHLIRDVAAIFRSLFGLSTTPVGVLNFLWLSRKIRTLSLENQFLLRTSWKNWYSVFESHC